MKRHLAAALLAVGALTACGGDDGGGAEAAAAPKTVEVPIKTFAYMPKDLVVTAGTKVTWRNEDKILHTVTTAADAPASFDLELADQGATGSFTFTKAGTYRYICSVHPGMEATVTVM